MTLPDTTTPLLRDGGGENNKTILTNLGALAALIGTWNSPPGDDATGYNVMPLPADNRKSGYLLKNLSYYEELTFSVPPGTAPNRGGDFQQNCYILFYEQRVYIAKVSPDSLDPENSALAAENTLIHAENGTLLHLVHEEQPEGAFPPPNLAGTPGTQDPKFEYAMQISVPHGNSILTRGGLRSLNRALNPDEYPMANRNLPPFTDPNIKDPNSVLYPALQQLVESKHTSVQRTDIIDLSSSRSEYPITNIPFEQNHADVTDFDRLFYLVTLASGEVVLQYTQQISFKMLVNGNLVPFIHIDANTLTKVG